MSRSQANVNYRKLSQIIANLPAVALRVPRLCLPKIQGRGARGPNPEDKSVRTFRVQIVEVEVDTETGEVRVLRVVAAHGCGRIINPSLVESQVIGGVTQGLGFALTEERVLDAPTGLPERRPRGVQSPDRRGRAPITHATVDLPDPDANPTGAKGIGEPPLVPTAPAIANAVFDAIAVRLRELPLSRVRAAP